jgi:glycosyltransferase involved in cell wall biosynthesis
MHKIKIAIGMNLQEGPFGGGNQFGQSLSRYLRGRGVDVTFSLEENDVDIILLTETRKFLQSCAFDIADVIEYRQNNPNVLIVFRINECDERKNHKVKILNKLIREGLHIADHNIFISSWLKSIFLVNYGYLEEKSTVILNGADHDVFNDNGYCRWNKKEPLKIVTHHWGANWYKGFDIYTKINELLENKYKNKIFFTFVGNLPKNINLKSTKVIYPLSGLALAHELKKNHVYVTGTMNEPAGMHHIEGALCGLPLLFRNSGALPEYCKNFGISFNDKNDFEDALIEMMQEYDIFLKRMKDYNNTSDAMNEKYYELFLDLIRNKKKFDVKRRMKRSRISFHKYKTILLSLILKLMR